MADEFMMRNLQDMADRYERDVTFRALVGMIEHGLFSGQYSIQEFRDATTLAAWRVADRTIRPINFRSPPSPPPPPPGRKVA